MTEYKLQRLDEVDGVMKEIGKLLIEENCSREKFLDLALCIRESLNNAILHGNGGDESLPVCVMVDFAQRSCLFTVKDCGSGVAEEAKDEEVDLLSESGRGLLLMKELLDELEFGTGYVSGKMSLE